jgi:hypothetical protein
MELKKVRTMATAEIDSGGDWYIFSCGQQMQKYGTEKRRRACCVRRRMRSMEAADDDDAF